MATIIITNVVFHTYVIYTTFIVLWLTVPFLDFYSNSATFAPMVIINKFRLGEIKWFTLA